MTSKKVVELLLEAAYDQPYGLADRIGTEADYIVDPQRISNSVRIQAFKRLHALPMHRTLVDMLCSKKPL
jgi:hypothetical protein